MRQRAMNVDELIAALARAKERHGTVEVVTQGDEEGGEIGSVEFDGLFLRLLPPRDDP